MTILIFLLLGSLVVTSSQRLPENNDNSFIFDIPSDVVFYDTKVLPEAKEVLVFLSRNETKRFFFDVENSKKPIFFAVTPCSSAIDWRIFFRYHSATSENRRLDDPLSQQRDLLKRPKRSKRLLQAFSGNDMMSYMSREFRAGLFILELLARDRHTTALLYATSIPDAEMAYPEVPSSGRIDVIQSDSEAVTVAWKESPSELRWSQPIEYCVAYNMRKNYRTMCSLQADVRGEAPPPVPQYAGFGFHWEKGNAKQIARMRKAMLPNLPVQKDIHVECVGRRTWFTMVGLLPGTQYFVDVFAISPLSNRSTAYSGTSFITEGEGDTIPLPERQVLFVPLRHKQQGSAVFEYKLDGCAKQITIDVLPCFGHLDIEIQRGDEIVASAPRVRYLRKFLISHSNSSEVCSSYTVHVTGDDKQTQSLKILATRRPARDLFPNAPNDPRLSIVDQATTCNSVQLSWPAPDEKALYCLYRRKDNSPLKRLFAKQDWCNPMDVAKKNEKIFCRRYRRFSKQRSRQTIRETIGNLRPGVSYVFELQLTRRKGETLSYEPARVTTRTKC